MNEWTNVVLTVISSFDGLWPQGNTKGTAVSGQLQWQIITGQHLLWLRRHHRLGLSCESNTCKTLRNKNKTHIFKTTDCVTPFITYPPLRCKMSWRFRSSELWCCVIGLHCDTLEIGESPERFTESGLSVPTTMTLPDGVSTLSQWSGLCMLLTLRVEAQLLTKHPLLDRSKQGY